MGMNQDSLSVLASRLSIAKFGRRGTLDHSCPSLACLKEWLHAFLRRASRSPGIGTMDAIGTFADLVPDQSKGPLESNWSVLARHEQVGRPCSPS
jgi:hypothetical protein